ncbi:hypothetical protein [Gottfriedia acidiceleris]|uniref:NADH dehydrogenase subunit 6 n=1 Tax=Gottfriedia acidiceleris TaxID=371036 RepID=A0ABY4JRM3_9BACI|nr:hypothetical protein [Gottfriedia acidiceleris]UPM56122.1 hypothetical protein MY490_09920 [Gottfriedia acidiceleris]
MIIGWTCIILSILITFFSTYFLPAKKDQMNLMMYIMMISMTVGLGTGAITTITLQKHFLISLLLSMGISGLVGLVIGMRLHFIALIEGLFTGIMSGMMGSMTVSMLTPLEAKTFLLICLLLITCTALFFSVTFVSNRFPKLFSSHFPIVLITSLLLIFSVYFSFVHIEQLKTTNIHHNEHSH